MKYLWKVSPQSEAFEFLTEEELPSAGFQSVYAIPETEVEALERDGYAGYKGPSLAPNRLWVDCDNDEAVAAALAVVSQQGLDYEFWETGNRGAHIGILRTFQDKVTDHAAVDKEWVKEHIPTADLKLYTTLHLLRRPGALHKKTGRRKRLLESVKGNTLLLPPSGRLQKTTAHKQMVIYSVFQDPTILALSLPQYDGERHSAFLPLAKRLAEAGASEEFTFEWMCHVNLLGDPWPEAKILSIAQWAHKNVKTQHKKDVR